MRLCSELSEAGVNPLGEYRFLDHSVNNKAFSRSSPFNETTLQENE